MVIEQQIITGNTPILTLELALSALTLQLFVDPQTLNQDRGLVSRYQTLEGLTPSRLGSLTDKTGFLSVQIPLWPAAIGGLFLLFYLIVFDILM